MAKAIMIQGTMSSAGKSLFATALCRIFAQDGYKVAPFKSQNMALNSYVTKEGLEMGRAQVVQAMAGMTEPSVLMNPILLKPTTDMGSQVILHGKVKCDMHAIDYFKHKKALLPEVEKAYRELEKKYDIIVIEGAGSPVELNLKSDDIVNMGMAKVAKAPVLLVGDIDKGGVFAQLIGTLMLLDDDEKDMVKGLVVNKFRGDIRIFDDGVKILKERTQKEVIGVVPYINCNIEDEDSVSRKLENRSPKAIDIAVIYNDKISNFTDFDVFAQFSGVSVRYVKTVEELLTPDMIIIPGSKSTINDMLRLRENGIEARIKQLASNGVAVFGICGGYQMLGKTISDPLNSEGGGRINGMGLLDVDTVFSDEKKTKQVSGRFSDIGGIFSSLSNMKINGYEIHMGESKAHGTPLCRIDDSFEGAQTCNTYGTYVHGVFDSEGIASTIIKALCDKKGISFEDVCKCDMSANEYREKQFDILANEVRKSVDMDMIYRILEAGI